MTRVDTILASSQKNNNKNHKPEIAFAPVSATISILGAPAS